MKKLLIGLAVTGLLTSAGALLARDLQADASADASTMAMSQGAPAPPVCQGKACDAKPVPLASKAKGKATKPVVVACTGKDC